MADKRELILEQLVTICETFKPTDIKNVFRNRDLVKQEQRPAIVVLDGDETGVLIGGRRVVQTGQAAFAPQLMTMAPEIYIVLPDERPTNTKHGTTENIGTLLNDFHQRVIEKIANDATLLALLGSNGGIVLQRVATALKSGLPLDGQMRLDFEFTYVLNP